MLMSTDSHQKLLLVAGRILILMGNFDGVLFFLFIEKERKPKIGPLCTDIRRILIEKFLTLYKGFCIKTNVYPSFFLY